MYKFLLCLMSVRKIKLTEKFENSEQAKVNTEQKHCFHVKNYAKLPAAPAPSPLLLKT